MSRTHGTLVALTCLIGSVHAYGQGWVEFTNETSTRLVSDPAVGANDTEEKDYIWGDLDQDGDIDLVSVRKTPFTFSGGKVNVLFMNEGIAEGHAMNGVLVDRTAEYMTAADDGGSGFNDLTNDRDVALGDVNDDGWLDIITATTLSHGLPKTISHPRVYINLGEDGGVWQGFRYEESRIPQLYTIGTNQPVAPRFCSIDAGDVTGDGIADLYFGDYDSSGGGGEAQPPGVDLNDRLLINDGTGFFTDSLQTRMTGEMLLSAFGTAVVIADMNGDGVNDIVKDTGLQTPTRVSISYNDPNNEGNFNLFDVIYTQSPYFVTAGDLNGDDRLDLVIVDDGTDKYLLNQGNVGGEVQWTTFNLVGSNDFGSNTVIDDLNNDGHPDILIADVDVDGFGCARRTHIYRNLGDGPNVSYQEQGQVIPNSMLTGTHDIACFDIDQDGWKDLVIGRCSGTQVWMNVAPQGLIYSYPNGLPAAVQPNEPFDFEVVISPFAGAVPVPGSGKLFISINGGPFTNPPLTFVGDDGEGNLLYSGTLPGIDCPGQISYYVSSTIEGGDVLFDPPDAPATTYTAIAYASTEIDRDTFEEAVVGWTVIDDPGLTSGSWELADPNGTFNGPDLIAPEDDATQGVENVIAWVTENGPPGGAAAANDIDGGATTLISPAIDLSDADAQISFARWFVSQNDAVDTFTVDISNDDGANWVAIPELTLLDTGSAWLVDEFLVSDYVTPSATVRLRFTASDAVNPSITEAGFDNFQVTRLLCEATCPADIAGPAGGADGNVDSLDFLALIAQWGSPCAGSCEADITGGVPLVPDGNVDSLDYLLLIAQWGSPGNCP